ncbi:alpha/beta fold hydrolase [Myceligenerans pegani]|uniref:Alpha/beta fold hydrolase n=1 Tax=Myceligenerans pegani TaxID=2776917 RepID=A0ABR9N1R0_9MICO|nr:alpha/beta hydrolase [Myceligenerans sp. TRM 65318]MBE1877589.1 alpha/beta fold hydrolase [Myceligenerans sp. TRM 65318]MBE3019860.1 alpha/beta fold hydrolase [Myceligenerans sp. TRM 65318]
MHLTHDTTGSGPDVLLLHAGVADSRMWGPQVAALAENFRVTTCDLRGYGDTPLDGEPYSDADDVKRLLDTLKAPAAVVGASAGGHVALQIASGWPDLVDRLVLLNPAYPIPATRSLERFARREDVLLSADDLEGATELNVSTWVGPEADAAARDLVRTMQRHAFEVQLGAGDIVNQLPGPDTDLTRVTARTLVVSGGQDLDHFREVAHHVVRKIDGARHVQLGWAGHLPSLERPDEITELIGSFLAED